jgi:hypothetical protein
MQLLGGTSAIYRAGTPLSNCFLVGHVEETNSSGSITKIAAHRLWYNVHGPRQACLGMSC